MNAQLKVGEHTELAPLDRAERVLGFVERKAQLADLARKSERIVEITGTTGYQEAQGARMALKNTRVEIQKLGKAAREHAAAEQRAQIAAEAAKAKVVAQAEQDAREAEAVRTKAACDAEAARLREERAQLERDQAETARIRLERELAEVTLVAAATEARDLLVSEGRSHHPVTMKLTAALAREQEVV